MNQRSAAARALVACVLLYTGSLAQVAAQNLHVSVNGNTVEFSESVLMVDMQYPLLPANTFMTALGATSDWNAAAQQLQVQLDETQLLMWADRNWVTVNGTRQDLVGGLQTLNGAPYVRGAETARLLGVGVDWQPETLTLALTRGVIMPEGTTVTATLLEVMEAGSLLVRVAETDEINEVPVVADAVIQRAAAGEDPAPVALTDLRSGDLLEIVLDDAATAVGVNASYAEAIGTIASIQANQLTLQDGTTYPLGARVRAVGSDGQPLHLLAAVGRGAMLTLNPSTNAVWRILAQRVGTVNPPETAQPVIATFTVPGYDRPLGQGGVLEIRIVGSAGATANVQLGAAGPTVTVPENEPGQYYGTMEIPADLLIPNEYLLAQLEIGEATSETVQSDRSVLVDSQAPVFEAPTPQDGVTIADANTNISVNFHDGAGIGIDAGTATLSVDRTDVTEQTQVQEGSMLYDTPDALTEGPHSASATIADALGNAANYTWNWTVGEGDQPILTLSHDAAAPLAAGDTLTVTMEVAAAGQAASFSIEGVAADIAMERVGETNSYQGAYTIQEGDATAGATVTATFTAADGAQYQANAPAQVVIAAPGAPFAITTPAEGARTGRRIRPAGTAPAGASVRWTVSYREFILAGDIATATVQADAAGNWQAEDEVDLRLLLVGMADNYTLTAELLNEEGAVQQTEAVEFDADD